MSLFGQYEIIKNENSLLTCKDTTNKYLIETNMNNSFYDESLNIIKQDNVIIMPYYEYNLTGLYKQFPQLINADNVKCIIQLLLEKLKEMDKKEMKFATTNIFITEKLEIKILPINIEYDVECISTFFMSNVAIIAVELMLHENTERNIQLKDILYNGILDPRIKEITGDDLYTIIENLYNGRNVQLNVDLAEFTYLIKSVVFGIEVVKPKVTVINAKSLQTNSCTGTVCVEAKCNFVNIKCDDNLNERYIDEKNSPDSSAIIDKINILDVKPIIAEVPVTKKQTGMVVINEEIVSKKKYTITTLNKNLFEIENAHHANVKKEEIVVNDTKTPTRENLDNEIRKGRFLVKQNQPLSIFNKDNMNKMKQIIEKQKKLIAYLKRDTTKYKNEIKKLEDELKDLGCIVEEETYSKGATC